MAVVKAGRNYFRNGATGAADWPEAVSLVGTTTFTDPPLAIYVGTATTGNTLVWTGSNGVQVTMVINSPGTYIISPSSINGPSSTVSNVLALFSSKPVYP